MNLEVMLQRARDEHFAKMRAFQAWMIAKNQEAALYAPIHQPFYKRLWALLNRDI